MAAKRKMSVPKRAAAGGAKGSQWSFPKVPLEESTRVAQAINDMNGGQPMHPDDLCKALGFSQPADWRFQDLARAASQFGLIVWEGIRERVKLTPSGSAVVAPTNVLERYRALKNAFCHVEVLKNVAEHYKWAPKHSEFFDNTVVRDFDVPRDRLERFNAVFFASLAFVQSFHVPETDDGGSVDGSVANQPPVGETGAPDVAGRVHLERCFVMMPFGGFFDIYYRDVYVGAVRDAGFEPFRVDEVFSSAAVIDQIYGGIRSATVVLAELTNKNPNVFYEMGLAHALRKPIVYLAASVDDLPFDIKHLKVIIYDVRQPGWDRRLREQITEYLKQAKKEPKQAVPKTFWEDTLP